MAAKANALRIVDNTPVPQKAVNLDQLIHERVRLGIVSALAATKTLNDSGRPGSGSGRRMSASSSQDIVFSDESIEHILPRRLAVPGSGGKGRQNRPDRASAAGNRHRAPMSR